MLGKNGESYNQPTNQPTNQTLVIAGHLTWTLSLEGGGFRFGFLFLFPPAFLDVHTHGSDSALRSASILKHGAERWLNPSATVAGYPGMFIFHLGKSKIIDSKVPFLGGIC